MTILVLDVIILVPGCGNTGPRMWKYWSLDVKILVPGCVNLCPEMLPEKFGTFLKKKKVSAVCQDKTVACQKLSFLSRIPL